MAYLDVPIRNRKGLARAAHRRHLVQPMQPPLDDPFFPLPNRSIWHGGINAGNEMKINPYYATHNPLSQASFFSNPSNAFQYNAAATYDPSGYPRRSNSYTDDDEDGIRGGTSANDSHTHRHEQNPPISFAKATHALHDALSATETSLREEDVRLACRKLRVGCAALGELLEGVREERERCAALLRDLKSCREVLEGIGVGGGVKGDEEGGEEGEGGEWFE